MPKIIEITIRKTRTISVDGLMGRDKYRKIEAGVVGHPDEGEAYEAAYKDVNDKVDAIIKVEIEQLKADVLRVKKRSKL